jgi:hypothetical protein
MTAIPDRQPIVDHFQGFALQIADQQVLALGQLPDSQILASGDLVIRYGIEYLGKPQYTIVPGLVALDYGDMLTGEEAWDFLHRRSNLFPRADVLGYRNDGVDDMIVVKLLDLAQPVRVLVYSDEAMTKPLAQPTALIAGNTSSIPPRLLDFLPQYHSIEELQAAQHD